MSLWNRTVSTEVKAQVEPMKEIGWEILDDPFAYWHEREPGLVEGRIESRYMNDTRKVGGPIEVFALRREDGSRFDFAVNKGLERPFRKAVEGDHVKFTYFGQEVIGHSRSGWPIKMYKFSKVQRRAK